MGDFFNSPVKYNRSLVHKVAILLGLICALPIVGFVATKSQIFPLLVLGAGLAPIGVFLVTRHIELGLVAMLLSGVFVRFRLPTGTASELVISLLLCVGILGLWVLRMATVDKRLKLKPTPVNFPLLAFVITVFVSLAWSRVYRDVLVQDFGSPFVAIASAVVMALLPITFLLVANLIQDERWLRAIVWVFLAEGLVSLGVSFIIGSGIGPANTVRRLAYQNGLFWINTQGLFSTWFMSFALALALFNRRLSWAWRVALLVFACGWVYVGFVQRTSWLSGWVPAFAAAAVIAFLRSKKLFVVLLVVMVAIAGRYYLQTAFEVESTESGYTRLSAYEVNWRITGQHLLLGTGPAGYAAYYMSYFPMEGMASHSNFIDVVAQTGIVGSFFLVWFFGGQIRGSYRLRRRLQGRGDFNESLSVAVLSGTIGCIVGMALGDWLFPFAYTQGIVGFDAAMFNWFFMGSIWALNNSLGRGGSHIDRLETSMEATT